MAKEKNTGKTVHYNKDPRAAADNAEEIRQSLADNAIQGTVIHQPN